MNETEMVTVTDKQRQILYFFLTHENKPTNARQITKQLKDEGFDISNEGVLKMCPYLVDQGMLKFKKIKPRRYGSKTEHYFIPENLNSFRKVAYQFLRSNDESEKMKFLQSDYVQSFLNEELICDAFYEWKFNISMTMKSKKFSDMDKAKLSREIQARSKDVEYLIYEGPISPEKRKELQDRNPNAHLYDINRVILNVNFPYMRKAFTKKEFHKRFKEINDIPRQLDPDISSYDFVSDFYKDHEEKIGEIINRFLTLIQISPTALYEFLFFDPTTIFDEAKEKFEDPNLIEWQALLLATGEINILMTRLILDVVFDLSHMTKLPKHSIVDEARIHTDTSNDGDYDLLQLVVGDESYRFWLGFTIDKERVKSMSYSDVRIDKFPDYGWMR